MTHIDGAVPVRRKRKAWSKPHRHPYDRRTLLGRRVKALVTTFRARIGADAADPVTEAAIIRTAEMVALSEQLRARAFRGEDVSPDDVLRCSRAAEMMTRRLHLDRYRPAAPSQSLQHYLNGKTEAGG